MLKDARQTVAELLRANQTLQRLFVEFGIDFESVQNLLVKDALIANDTLIQATTVYNLSMNPLSDASIEAINLKVSQKLGLYPTYITAPHSTNYKTYLSTSGTSYTYLLKWLYYTYKFFNEEQFFFNNLLNHYVPSYDSEIVSSTTNLKIYFDGLGILLDSLDQKIENLYTLGNIDTVDDSFLKHIAQLLGYQLEDFSIQNISFRELIKNLIDIYKTKGTDYSFELFFKLLGFETEIREYYWDRDAQNPEAFGSIVNTNYLWYLTAEDPRTRTTEQPIDSNQWVDPKDLRVFNILLNSGYSLDEVLGFKDSAIPEADRFTYFKTNYIKFNLTQYYTKQDLTAKDTDTILKYIKFLTPIYVSALIEVETLPYVDEFTMENTDTVLPSGGSGDPGSPSWVDILMPFIYVTLRDYIPLQLSPTSENEIAIVNSGSIDNDLDGYGDDALPTIFGSPGYGIEATGTVSIGATVNLSVNKYINIKLDEGRGTKISIPGASATTINDLMSCLDAAFISSSLSAQTALVGISPNRDVRIYSNTYSSYSKILMLPGITNDLFTGLSTTIDAPTDGYTANRGFQDLGLTLVSGTDATGLVPGTTYEFYINVDSTSYSEVDTSGPTAASTTKADIVNAINNHFDLIVESDSVPSSTIEDIASDVTTNGTVALAYKNVTTSSGKMVLMNTDGTIYKTNIDFTLYDCRNIALASSTSLTNRRFLIAWYDTVSGDSKWIVYDDEGEKVTLEALLDSNTAVDIAAATLSNDNIAVAYTYGSSGKVSVFDISGASPSLLFTSTWSNDAISSGSTAISALGDGFVVAGNKASGGVIVYFNNDGTYLLGSPDLVSSTIAFTAVGEQTSSISLQETEAGNIFITYRANDTVPADNKVYIAIFDNTGTEILAANAITADDVDFVKSTKMMNDSILIPYCKTSDGIGYYQVYSPDGDLYKKERVFYNTSTFSEMTIDLVAGEDIAFSLVTPTSGYFSYWSYLGEPASLSGNYLVISSSAANSTWDDDVDNYSDTTDAGHFFRMGTNAYEHDNYSSALRTAGVSFVGERNRYNTFYTASPDDDLIDLVEDTLQFAFTLLISSTDHPADRVEAAGFHVRRNGYITRNQSQESFIGANMGPTSPRVLGYYTRKQDYSEPLRVDDYRINSEIDWVQWKKLGATYDEWSSWALAVEYFEIPSIINANGYIGGEVLGAPIIPIVISGTFAHSQVALDQLYTMSGEIILSGAYTRHFEYAAIPGVITLSGAATTSAFVYYRFIPSGGMALSGASTTTHTRVFAKVGSGGLVLSGSHYRPEVHMVFIPIMAVTPMALGGAALTMEYLLSGAGGMILSGAAVTSVVEVTHIAPTATGGMILSGASDYTIEFSYLPLGQETIEWIILSGAAETYRDRFYIFGNGDINEAIIGMLGSYTLGPFGLGAVFTGTGGLVTAGAYTYGDFGLGFEWEPTGGGILSGAAETYRDPIEYTGSGLAFSFGGGAFERTPVEYELSGNGEAILSGAAETYRDPIEYTGDGEATLGGSSIINLVFYYSGSDSLSLSGASSSQLIWEISSSGVATLSGSSINQVEDIYTASGDMSLNGSAAYNRDPEYYSASGDITISGTAANLIDVIYIASGSMTLSGVALTQQGEVFGGSGPMTLSGAAPTNYEISDPEDQYYGDGYYGDEYFV